MRQIINSTQIGMWFRPLSRDAQELLPHLVRRLILATTEFGSFAEFRIPVGDEVGRPGYDGRTRFDGTHPYIPTGISVWEMGVGDPDVKANTDYTTRTAKPGEVTPADTAFVFVTPHRWPGKDRWLAARRQEQVWKDVRVVDDADLAAWLEAAPGVGRWLAREMSVPVEHLRDLKLFWDEQQALYGVPVSIELAIGGRSDAAKAIEEWLDSNSASLTVEGESVEEASCFIAASLATLAGPKRDHYETRLLFVDGPQGLDAVSSRPAGLLLVPTTDEARLKVKAVRSKSVRSLLPRGRVAGGSVRDASVVRLGAMRREACEATVQTLGLTSQEARRVALESKGSLGALLWMVAKDLERPPSWTQPTAGRELVPLMLAGQWMADQPGDREAVAKLAGREYVHIEDTLARWGPPDGPIVRRGITWDWRGWDYAWRSLLGYVDAAQLDRFAATVLEVLTTPDPRLELDPDQRWASQLYGKAPRYSSFLLAGLVESVARIAVSPETVAGRDGQTFADGIVDRLLGSDPATILERFKSLANFLPDLAEASPTTFLNAVEILTGDAASATGVFQEAGFMSTSPHVYLLWALERLAWSDELFTRIALNLGKLTALDPGGTVSNRPLHSLTELFLPWHPQTTADVNHRLEAIDQLRNAFPDVAWKLAETLLPDKVRVSRPTAAPEWRQWKPEVAGGTTNRAYWQSVDQVVQRMLAWAGEVGTRWVVMAETYATIAGRADDTATKVLAALDAIDPARFSATDRRALGEGLRELITRHREYHDAKWALRAEHVSRLDQVYEKVRPDDPADQNAWLFAEWPDLPDGRKLRFEERQRKLAELRRAAVGAIWESGGVGAIFTFVERVEAPEAVGQALAELGLGDPAEEGLLNETLAVTPDSRVVPKLLRLALGYVGQRHLSRGRDWLASLRSRLGTSWDANQWANLAWGLPTVQETWEFVRGCGPEADQLYWQRVAVAYLHQGGPDLEYAATRLLDAGRPARVIFIVGLAVRSRRDPSEQGPAVPVRTEVVVRALREVLDADRDEEWYAPAVSSLAHHVERLLDGLEADGLDLQTLVELEWSWLNALEHSQRGPKALQRALCESPEFFVNLLTLVYRGEGEASTEVTPEQSARATHAYRLLSRWKEVPGVSTPEGQSPPVEKQEGVENKVPVVDPEKLLGWVTRARELSVANGRLKACDNCIGGVIAHSPADADGLWPCEGVRTVLEQVRSEELDRAIIVGVWNKRGVFSPSAGHDERKLSARYREYADREKARWPYTASICSQIADQYARDADREAKEAELEEYS